MISPTRVSLGWTCFFLAAIVALAALLRGLCLSAELWLDEVWSWEFARSAETPWQIFTGPNHHHDNNHKLNTLYLFFIPDGEPFAFYRLHSFFAGLASVLLAFRAVSRRGSLAALFAALLVAVNYWFVLCSAEARGYALALALALAAFDGLQRHLRDGGVWYLVQFWFAVLLGFLAHLTFLHAYLALAVWSVYHFARHRAAKGSEIVQLLRVHAVPAAFVALLFLTDVRGMQLGGGPPIPVEEVLGRLLCFGLGVPFSFWGVLIVVIVVVAVYVRGVQMLRLEMDDSWAFFAMATLGAPLMVLAARPPFIYERYFFLPFLFFLLLFAYVLADLAQRSLPGRIAAGVVLLLISTANFGEIMEFVQGGGRGDFLKALQTIDANNGPGDVTITSDSDVRVPKMLAFYNHYLKPPRHFHYVKLDDWQERARLYGLLAGAAGRFTYSYQHAPEWLLIERPERNYPPAEKIAFPEPGDAPYEMDAAYEVTAFGGWNWYVYRRVVVAP
jgi:hypothetical protein